MKIKDMSLTDDWKAGKLRKNKNYFVRVGGKKKVYPARLYSDNAFSFCGNGTRYFPYDKQEIKVLAVCSYDHFVELTKKVKKIEKEVVKGDTITGELLNEGAHIKKENRQLRQLLKEVKEKIHNEFINQDIVSIDKFNKILTRITEVLK